MKQILQILKQYVLFVLLLLISNYGWGQISESFESGLPTGYNSNLNNIVLNSGTWQIKDVIVGTTGVSSGAKSAQIRSATAAQIITPTISGGVGIVSFYVRASTSSGAYQVNLSTDNGLNWTPAIGSPFTIGTTQTLKTITINNSNVNKIQIYRTGATIYIDDFVTTTFAPTNTPPTASPTFSGVMNIGETVTADSGYSDTDGDAEGVSTFKWYRAYDAIGTNETAISGATTNTYTLTTSDEAKYIRVGVVPVDSQGASGEEAFSVRQLVNSRPVVSNVSFLGVLNTTQELTGSYTYYDADSDAEGTTQFQWYRSDDAIGTNEIPISGATNTSYTLTNDDLGKYIAFGVTPIAAGSSPGVEVKSTYQGAVVAAGTPSVTLSEVLTENSLNASIVLNLVNTDFIDSSLNTANFILNNAPSGLSITSVSYVSTTEVSLTLAYDNTDFDSDITNFSITIAGSELTSGSDLTTAELTIFAELETIEVSGTLAFGDQCIDKTSAALSFNINGSNLKNANINIESLSGYTFSETESGSYSPTLSFAHSGGTLASKTIYVKFAPNNEINYDGNIVVTSVGVLNNNQVVTGTGVNTIPVLSGNTSTSITASTATLGSSVIAIGCNEITVRGVELSTTDGFANGTGVIFSESGSFVAEPFTVDVTNLSSNTTYYFKAFATSPSGTSYATQGTFTTDAISAPVAIEASEIGATNFTANWNAVPGATSYEIDVYEGGVIVNQDVAIWTFPLSGTNVTPDIASSNNATKNLTTNVGSISSSAGVDTQSASTSDWTSGSNSKFWQIELNTSGFSNIMLSSKQRSSSTGPRDFKIQYNIGFGWIDITGGVVTVANDFTTGVISNLVLPSICNNQSSLLIRWIMTSNTAVNNSTVASSGTSRIDDIYILGDLSSLNFVTGYSSLNIGNVTSFEVTGLDPNKTYKYVVRALDATSVSVNSNEIELTTSDLLSITSSLTATATIGNAFTYTISTNGTPTSYAASGMPSGLSIDTATGVISGTPTEVGTFSVSISATNSGGTTTETLELTVVQVTTIVASQCNSTIEFHDRVYSAGVSGASGYKFNIYNAEGTGEPLAVIENPYNFFRFTQIDFEAGVTYLVKVQVKQGTIYGAEGTGCLITLGTPTTTLIASQCNQTIQYDARVYPIGVTGANRYRFNIYNAEGTGEPIAVIENPYNFFRFTQMDFTFGATYQVGVEVKRGNVYGPQGALCSVTLSDVPTTNLIQDQCDARITYNDRLYPIGVYGATGYRFNIYNAEGTGEPLAVIENPYNFFRFTQMDFTFGATYQVSVEVKRGNVYGPEGTFCSVTLSDVPTTTLIPTQCNTTITYNDRVYPIGIQGATGYRFKIYNAEGIGEPLAVIENPYNFFRFTQMDFTFGATYQVGVEVKRGGVYGKEGSFCSVTLNDFPTTTLIPSQCGATISQHDRLYPIGVQGATGYAFDIYESDGVTLIETVENPYNFFRFTQIDYILGEVYYIKVRVKRGDQYGAQGAACLVQLNDPNARDLWDKKDDSVSEVVTTVISAYPNPFTTTFSISPMEGETATLFYQVYDVTGKMIESRSVEANEITNHTIGEQYPAGMYLVIVRQGATTQKLKMVKQ